MKMNKKDGPVVTREVWKSVKKFDRQKFDGFCMEIYKSGFEDGRNSVPGVDAEKVLAAIGEVKGIGDKKLADIKEKLDKLLSSE